jgi:hypothetical protein
MTTEDRNLLDVLKSEMDFLEKGGYGSSPREPWRCPLIFEDSPSCMNYDTKDHPAPCEECVLTQLVPAENRGKTIPCRHIPLSPNGDTLKSLYRWASQREIEDVMRNWLRTTIARLEEVPIYEASSRPDATVSMLTHEGVPAQKGTAMLEQRCPNCANPACHAAFN